MREFGATAPEAEHLRVSLYTGGYRLTRQEPLNNSVRITIQALAAVLGGVQHIGTLSIDEALSTPSAEAARLAVRTQQILAYEARVGHVVDPLGGSHYVEWLTDELEARILAELAQVDGWGGGLAAVRSGSIQGRIDDRAYAFERDIASGRRVVVGVNSFRPEVATDPGIRPFRVDDSVESRQRERLAATRARRDADAVAGALRRLRQAAVDGENVMEPMKDAVRAYATVGEIYGMLRDVYGDWRADGIFL
jgi:methylmalonyl-CoA mutase N-terminal domain/subunit